MTRRRWLEGCVLVCAALATMATSRPSFHKSAGLPPNDATSARVVVVEASMRPGVQTSRPAGASGAPRQVTPLDPEVWPGRNRYLVPKDYELADVYLSGKKQCSGMCGACEDPPGLAISVVSITPAQTWTLQAAIGPQVDKVPAKGTVEKTLSIDAPVGTQVWVAEDVIAGVVQENGTIKVSLYNISDTEAAISWTLTARVDTLCPDPAVACAPPAGTAIKLGAPQ